ncbi:hypothetical protein EVAR_37967_1 [Eumeta japonica]|uniref:SWIM-type domain-containing protein n=1 Tax=Eumeta variegata TaxID=151549 RepID=A0A4C1YYE9_EUMVA|nr:hypothetical protein EVAR_37967_1 [Eumeta japonica]
MRIDQALLNDRQHICHRCWVAATRHEARLNELDMEPQDLPQNPEQPSVDVMSITGYKRSANTSNSCLFPNCRADNLVRVPRFIKSRMLVEYKLYIPPSARICHVHLTSNEWNELEELNNSSFTAEHLKDMLDVLRDACQQSRFNFDNIESITTSELHFCTGLNHEEFNRLLEQTPSISQRSQRPKTVLGAYLMKIRTGEPNERLSSRLDMSRRSLERKLELARECLTNEFVPRHLGWDHISREEIVARKSTIPNAIFGVDNEVPPAILICDGTYIYIQGRIKSRHVSGRIYYSYILINNRAETARESIAHYYCSCLTGKRTVGTCAHIMSIIWYLGWARHQPSILLPATYLDDIVVDNVHY